MPALSYTNSAFTPFTKIVSSVMNTYFTDIKTLLNTTKLDDTNIQTAGITPTTKLNQTGSSAGQFLASNGSTVVWTSNPLTAQFNVIFGSAAQVTAGTATHSAFSSWTQATGDRVLILPGYTQTANWTITANSVFIHGLGASSQITGSLTVSGTGCVAKFFRITNTVTLSGNTNNVTDIVLSSGISFTDNGTGNLVEGLQET